MRKYRGIALVLTLMLASILGMLAIAFVELTRTNGRFLGSAQDQMRAQELSETAGEYARMRLDAQPGWGIPSGSDKAIRPVFQAGPLTVYEGERNGVVRVVGITPEGHFQLALQSPGVDIQPYRRYSNASISSQPGTPGAWTEVQGPLDGVSVNYSLVPFGSAPLAPPRSSRRALPAGCANLQIETCVEGQVQWRDVTLKRSYVLDASAMSGGHLYVQLAPGARWSIGTADPTSNKLRARRSIVTPRSGQFVFGDRPDSGQALANEDILIDGRASLDSAGSVIGTPSGSGLIGNDALKAAAEAASNGTLSPQQTNYPVPVLTDAQLTAAPGATASLNRGLYKFQDANVVHYWSNPDADPSSAPDRVFTDTIPDSGGAGAAVYLKENKFIIPGKVQVEGDLVLSGAQGSRASLALGYRSDGTLPPSAPAGRLEVRGNVKVQAETVGSGTLIAKNNGGVTMEGTSALSASPTQGVAVYAEGPVKLDPPTSTVQGVDTRALDWEVYKLGLSKIDQNTVYHWDDRTPRMDPNLITSWTYEGVYGGASAGGGIQVGNTGNVNDPFVNGDDAKIMASETRDQIVASAPGDPIVQQLMNLARSTSVYQNDAAFAQQFDKAVQGYLEGWYDNYPFSSATYPIDPGLTLGRYERLKEILVKSEQDPTAWSDHYYGAIRCDTSQTSFGSYHFGESMYRTVEGLATQAGPSTRLSDYLAGANPFGGTVSPLDMVFKGLIYTHKNLYVKTNGHRFSVEGALVSREGDLVVEQSTGVDFRYNPTYFETLLNNLQSSDMSRIQLIFAANR